MVRAFVDRVVQEYSDGALQHKLWNAIAKQADSKLVRIFCKNVQNLGVYPPDPDSEWLLRLGAELREVSARAKARAASYRKNDRKQRLYAGILRAWTGTDERRRLGASDEGPAQRFLCAITRSLSIPLTDRGARGVITREQARREALFIREEHWQGTGTLTHKEGDEP
jgi:hypothetical protein